jgi:YD repeat-containing protein
VSSLGTQGNAASGSYDYRPAISADGRFIAFRSDATNLVPGVTGVGHVYRHDSITGTTVLVSADESGTPANQGTWDNISMSDDGRLVAFSSWATNLISDDTNAERDAFVKDVATGSVTRVSVSSTGGQANNSSYGPVLSRSGRYVAFESLATNLVANDANAESDIFLHDQWTGTTTLVSVSTSGVQANDSSGGFRWAVSDEGPVVAFSSWASNLTPTQGGTATKVFVRDVGAGTTTQVSVNSAGVPPSYGDSDYPDISSDGRYVAFHSYADGLVPEDVNGRQDVFVHDTMAQTTSWVSVDATGTPASARNPASFAPTITGNGRYVAFSSNATNWVVGASDYQIYVKDTATGTLTLASVATDGTFANGPSGTAALSADARAVAFFSLASNLVAGDTNGAADVFRRGVADWITRSPAELYGVRRAGGYAEDPVNTATGNLTDAVVDLDYPVSGLELRRTYNSLDTTSGPLGPGWVHSFASALSHHPATGDVVLRDFDGRLVTFRAQETGGYARPEELFGDLNRRLDGSWFIAYDDGRTEEFDAGGRLVERRDWDGQSVTLAYSGSVLTGATHSAGYSWTAGYDASGRLVAVTSSDGRAVAYTYGTNGALATVTDAAGGVTTYASDVSGRITSVVDPDGMPVVASTFDDRGRVATQTTPSGDTVAFSYDDATGRTTVTRQGSGAATVYAHDPDGRLIAVTDAHGAVLAKSYDAAGNLVAVTDRRGGALSQAFDARGNLLSRSGPEGVTETFTYDGAGRLSTITDGEADTTTFTYEGAERLPTTVVDGAGKTTASAVGADGLTSSITDADGVTVAFGYDARRHLTTTTDGAGKVTALGYDAAGNQTSQTTPLGLATTWTWDGLRRPLTTTDPSGATVSQAWTPAGRLATGTDAEGNPTRYDYDGAGRLQKVTDALGHETTHGYDADGNLTSITRPPAAVGQPAPVWRATYDALGRRTSETDPTGVTTSYGHDADGNLTTTTDENGARVTRTHDLRGRLRRVTDALGHQTSHGWDNADRLASVTDPVGAATSYSYDGAGRLVSATDAAGAVWSRGYTPAGRLATETDPLGHATTHAYDPLGRLASITDPEGAVTGFGYDHDGRLVSQTSPEGLVTTSAYDHAQRTVTVTSPAAGTTVRTYTARVQLAVLDPPATDPSSFAYDAAGRLQRATDALGHATTFAYDARGNRVSRTDAKGAVETYTHDAADRPTGRLDPLGRLTTLAYDNLGRLSSVSDPSGRSVSIGYDAASRVVSRSYAAGDFGAAVAITFGYDAADRRTSMAGPDGTTAWNYDVLGRLTSTTAAGKTLSYGYDPAGNRTSLTYPDESVATFGYDKNNRLISLAKGGSVSATYAYNRDGRLVNETLSDGTRRSRTYSSGRLSAYAETSPLGVARVTQLGYDAAGRIRGLNVDGRSEVYSYDGAGQLRAVSGGRDVIYHYDEVGNREVLHDRAAKLRTDYSYDAANQLVRTSQQLDGLGLAQPKLTTYDYDAAGRRTVVRGAGGSETTAYDAQGLPVEVAKTTAAGTVRSRRTFDGDGQLQSVTAVDEAGVEVARDLIWDDNRAVPEIAVMTEADVDTQLVHGLERAFAVRAGVSSVFSYDVHGSALATPATAGLVRATNYDEYGRSLDTPRALDPGTEAALSLPSFGYRGELQLGDQIHLRAEVCLT